jgi:hypothetical protein
VRLREPPTSFGTVGILDLFQVLARDLSTTRVDRRAAMNDRPFQSVYFIELEECGSQSVGATVAAAVNLTETHALQTLGKDSSLSTDGWTAFRDRVEHNASTLRTLGPDVKVLGVW